MKFERFIGNKKLKEQLSLLLETQRFPHAVIIEGDEGLGKKTLAAEIALALVCSADSERPCRECSQCRKALKGIHPDIIEFSPDESKKSRPFSVDVVRDIIKDAAVKPNEARFKVYILKECERMNIQAQNALLKIIEEPPEHAIFLLCTTSKSLFLETVLSRSIVLSVEGVDCSQGANYICESHPEYEYNDVFQALNLSGGNIGKALETLGDGNLKKLMDIANSVALASISSYEYELIKACSVLEKDRDVIIGALTFMKSILRDALLYDSKCEMLSNQAETVKKLASSLSKAKLLKMIEVCDNIIFCAKGNGNNALLITKLCFDLRRAQQR